MSFLNKFFESSLYSTLKSYTIFLTFLNLPYLLSSLIEKAKLTMAGICAGSSFMLGVQVDLMQWLTDWIGVLLGQKNLFLTLNKSLAGSFSPETAAAMLIVLGVVVAILILYLAVLLLGRFIPPLAGLQIHHRPTPWSMLYLLLFFFYIFISITS